MPHRNEGRKKSNFPVETSVLAGAFFDYFVNGVNFKISFTDLLVALGVTGTLVQDGAATGTPILDVAGSVNNIRNLENGPGVKASVSPENGVTLEHNLLSGVAGVPVFTDTDELIPIIRSIAAGPGISVSGAGDLVTIAFTGAPPTTDLVIINSVADFPTPVADVITLEANTTYSLQGLINIGNNRLVAPGGVAMFSQNRLTRGIISTTTGPLITANEVLGTVIFREMALSVVNGSYLATSGNGALVMSNVTGLGCGIISALGPMGNISFRNFTTIGAGSKGFLFTGAHGQFNNSISFYVSWTGTLFDFGSATFSEGIIFDTGVRFNTDAGQVAISGLANSGNLPVGAIALVLGNKFFGSGTALVNVTNVDARWQFFGNDTIGDTRPDGLLSLQSNAVATVIASAGVAVLVAGTWVVERTSQMTGTIAGKLTYNVGKNAPLPIAMAISVEPVSGGNQTISAYVALNGAIIANSQRTAVTSSGNPISIGVPWQIDFTTDDFVEIFVANDSGTTNLLVSSATSRVN